MNKDEINEIKSRVPILDLISLFEINVRSSFGNERQCSCPFHGEDKHPSARIYVKTNSMYCFTCKKSYDVIDIIREFKKLSFDEVIEFIKINWTEKKENRNKQIQKQNQFSLKNHSFYDILNLTNNRLEDIKDKIPFEKYLIACNYIDRISFNFECSEDENLKNNLNQFLMKLNKYDN